MELTTLAMMIGLALAIIGGLWTLFAAYREDRLIGTLYLLLPGPCKIPPALAFAFLYWEEARRPLSLQLTGVALLALAGGL